MRPPIAFAALAFVLGACVSPVETWDDSAAREAGGEPNVPRMATAGSAGAVRYGSSVCLVLDDLFNNDAIASEVSPRDGNFDRRRERHGDTFPWAGMPRGGAPFAPGSVKDVTFMFPRYADGTMNNVACGKQVIHVEAAAYRTLYVLGASEADSQEASLTLLVGDPSPGRREDGFGASAAGPGGPPHEASEKEGGDGLEKEVAFRLTDWCQEAKYGEVPVLKWGHRINHNGDRDEKPCAMFVQTIELPRVLLRGLRLPPNPRIHVFALTLQEPPTGPRPSAGPTRGRESVSEDAADAGPWLIGRTRQITWYAAAFRRAMASGQLTGPVRIEILRSDAEQWETIVDRTANDGHHAWRVTGPQTVGCRIRAVDINRPHVRRRCREEPTILGPETGTATLADTSRPGPQRWADIAGNPYSAAYNANYSYKDATVRVVYSKRAPTFMGRLEAEGLKPNFAYQIKLFGDRSDTWSFEAIGYLGRWLIDPGKQKRTNFKDAEYKKHRDNFDVEVQSYIFFDYFVTDTEGKARKSFSLDSSFHVTWNKELNLKRRGPGRRDSEVSVHTVQPQGKAYWWNVPIGRPIIQLWLEQEGVSPRPPMGSVELPVGIYKAAIQLTEESFHLKRNRGWARVLQAPILFEIARETQPAPPPGSPGPQGRR